VRKNPENTRVKEEGGGPGTGASGEDYGRADIHTAAPGGLHFRAAGYFLKEL